MLSFTGSLRILIALTPCDMRRSYDGLLGLSRRRAVSPSQLRREPFGFEFAFCFPSKKRAAMSFDIHFEAINLFDI